MPVYKYIDADQTKVVTIHDNGATLGIGDAPEGVFIEPYSGNPDEINPHVLASIAKIEATITQRRVREAVLTESGAAWLGEREAELEMLRQQLI